MNDFTERLRESFAQLWEFIPGMLGGLVVLFAGYLVAKLVERGTRGALKRVAFNDLLRRAGIISAVERAGSHINPTQVVANLVFWFVMFSVILVAGAAVGINSLASVFSDLVSYVPSVIAAIVIVIVGIVLGDFVGGLILASAGALHGGSMLARAGRFGVILLAVFMALQELGVATDIVTTAFAIVFGAFALALALSFGLGNRELAGQITRQWYENWKAEREAIEREAAEAAAAEGDTDGPALSPFPSPVHGVPSAPRVPADDAAVR